MQMKPIKNPLKVHIVIPISLGIHNVMIIFFEWWTWNRQPSRFLFVGISMTLNYESVDSANLTLTISYWTYISLHSVNIFFVTKWIWISLRIFILFKCWAYFNEKKNLQTVAQMSSYSGTTVEICCVHGMLFMNISLWLSLKWLNNIAFREVCLRILPHLSIII